MNDFTKEELVDIWRCINPVLIGDSAYDLKIKLQSMIDNYCEHKRCGMGECNNYPEECLRCNKKCEKCGEFYYERK